MDCGVPHGSILAATLFNLYMLPLGHVIRSHSRDFHSYADDTQLDIAVSPEDSGTLDALFNCILDIKSWMFRKLSTAQPGQNPGLNYWY